MEMSNEDYILLQDNIKKNTIQSFISSYIEQNKNIGKILSENDVVCLGLIRIAKTYDIFTATDLLNFLYEKDNINPYPLVIN
jgi:hypothetical protein